VSQQSELLVIGTGLAGLVFALESAEFGQVLLVSKSKLSDTNSALAQGGIASVMSPDDNFDEHINDTLNAGAGLCRKSVVEAIVKKAPELIKALQDWGVHFDHEQPDGKPSLTREGGHSKRRILHIGDHTGLDVHTQLLKKVKDHPNIEILDNHLVVDLILSRDISPYTFQKSKCVGAYLLNIENNEVHHLLSKATILATGGAGKVYLYTSNWSGATGDGIAMAYRAGARVANLEFMQFHPTCLFHPHAQNFLISEALRGEGGVLINSQGRAFMKSYHKLGSLAPRDIVARSIDAEMKKTGADCVFIDMTHKSQEELKKRFPQIFSKCLELGIDISKEPIPVVPAAHYLCGGVLTDMNGQTDITSLYAVGETACTGLHGANRLASNSLLECIYFSKSAAEHLKKNWHELEFSQSEPPSWHLHHKSDNDELIVISHMWEEIRRLMWNYVGIVRTNRRLKRAYNRLQNIKNEITEFYSQFKIHPDVVELRNIALIADLTVQCALKRKESRGIHFNADKEPAVEISGPQEETGAKDTIISAESFAGII